MLNASNRMRPGGTGDRTDTRPRTFNLLPEPTFFPFAEAGPLHEYVPTSWKPAAASSADTPQDSGSTSSRFKAQVEDCDFSQLSRKLVVFFRWHRADAADDLAQETLQRGFTKLASGIELSSPPAHYFFGIAYRVLHESRRTKGRDPYCIGVDLEAFCASSFEVSVSSCDDGHEQALARLEECLSHLSTDDRHIVKRYYAGDRDKLCTDLGVAANNLRVRVHRIVHRLRRLAASGDQACPSAEGRAGSPARSLSGDEFSKGSREPGTVSSPHKEERNTMSKSTRNTGKGWTSQERSQLRQLASQNTPTRVIGLKLGRTPEAVYSQASKQGTSLGPTNQSPYNRRTK